MGRRVLVVEDNRALNALVTDALTRHGFECLQAHDGEEALAAFASGQPDALVLDLNIPRLHGLEVLRRVKAERPFTVVVVLTGHGSEQTALQALKCGADDYLIKPLRAAVLAEALELHLQRADLQRCLDLEPGARSGAEERHLARIFFEAPTAVVHADPAGTIRAVNRAAARLLAREPRELHGRAVSSLVSEDVRGGWLDAVRREAGAPQGYEGEVLLAGPTGPVPAAVVAVERPEKGHLLLALRDLTRQKAMERRYFESKRLASLGRVVEGVAHEVRNPLASIGGFARKLRDEPGRSSRGDRYLGVILQEVERLEDMVRDIEAFVQFSRRRRPALVSIGVTAILEEVLGGVRERATAAGIQVHFDGAAGAARIYGNRSQMEQLFGGLVENACEAMPEGGRLDVGVQTVGNWVHVRVEDTGVGIADEDLDEIFDPFYTSKTSGAGLGLARAYLIVEDHSGTIDFQSELGKGTVCTVSLPLDRRRVRRAAA